MMLTRVCRVHPRNNAPVTAHGYLELIKARRLMHGLSQREAGARVGMTRANWSRVERGENAVPSMDRLSVMAEAVGLRFALVPIESAPLDHAELREVSRLVRWYTSSPRARAVTAALLSAARKLEPYAMEVERR